MRRAKKRDERLKGETVRHGMTNKEYRKNRIQQ